MLILFFPLVGFVALTRLVELGISRKHRRSLLRRGARAVSERGFAGMVLLHVAIPSAAIVEVLLARRSVPVWFASTAAVGVLLANALRIAAIRSLGEHWNVRVVDSTSLGTVSSGPYRFIRHPNYLAVFLELLLLPLVGGAWLTAAVGAALHAVVLKRRIAVEDAMLLASPGYVAQMGNKPRLLPGSRAQAAYGARLGEP